MTSKHERDFVDRLSQRSCQPATRTAKYFGEQAIEGHQKLTARRMKDANPRPQGSERTRRAAQRTAKKAEDEPMPTTRGHTIMGVVVSEEELKKKNEYKMWRARLEQEAINEVKAELSKEGKMSPGLMMTLNSARPRATGHPDLAFGVSLW